MIYRYFYSGATFALTEMDGVRIFSDDACDFVQKVPSKAPSLPPSKLIDKPFL